jgi:hypothetical protein
MISAETSDEILIDVLQPALWQKTRCMKEELTQDQLDEFKQQYAAFKASNSNAHTDVERFTKAMLIRIPNWRNPAGEALLAKIFQAVDVNKNGQMDEDEYLAALFILATYLSCSRKDCAKILDVINHGGQVCYQCGPQPYVLCHEVSLIARIVQAKQQGSVYGLESYS